MLRGKKVGLRALLLTDLPVLVAEMSNDVELAMIANGHPWRPATVDEAEKRYRDGLEKPAENKVQFAVEELATGELAGTTQLWGLDTHNRSAHLGFQLRPSFRGRGLGTDTIRTLCDYAFRVRGLHRLQVDTLASNAASIGAATANGFVPEGLLRRNAWVAGEFVDEALLGLLAEEWRALQ
jgi:RimJ/RimL family protein N-acetyltransferase